MASELHVFQFTIPANTPKNAPVSAPLTMPPREVTQINVKVPPGPHGLMGFQIGAAGTPVIPAIPGAWVVTDNEQVVWPLSNYIDSGAWQAFGYNTGRYTHTIQITFYCNVPGLLAANLPNLIDLSTLNSGIDGGS